MRTHFGLDADHNRALDEENNREPGDRVTRIAADVDCALCIEILCTTQYAFDLKPATDPSIH